MVVEVDHFGTDYSVHARWYCRNEPLFPDWTAVAEHSEGNHSVHVGLCFVVDSTAVGCLVLVAHKDQASKGSADEHVEEALEGGKEQVHSGKVQECIAGLHREDSAVARREHSFVEHC